MKFFYNLGARKSEVQSLEGWSVEISLGMSTDFLNGCLNAAADVFNYCPVPGKKSMTCKLICSLSSSRRRVFLVFVYILSCKYVYFRFEFARSSECLSIYTTRFS